MSSNEHKKGQLPMLTSMQLFLMTFGYAGVQVAFSVQTGNMGRYSRPWVPIQRN